MIVTGNSTSALIVFEDGRPTYPCRCGEIHRGEYAAEDYAHCNCLHTTNLEYTFYPGEIPGDKGCQVICIECGKIWDVNPPKTQ